ncbi:MAG: hypothetical protein E7Z90_06730 [Cyanobacteria bacterium SIG29]|nr:hypothetical protein [Cyanobacteria bacterium SIG29]
MRKILLLILIIPLILLCGFKFKQKPYVIVSSGTIDSSSIQRIERAFLVGQPINYALVSPDGLQYSGVRMQVSMQSEKTTNWGFSIEESNDLYIDKSSKIYRDYIYPRKTGHYILQFFYLNKKTYPFAHIEFVVR